MENTLAELKANKKDARVAGLWYLLMPVFMAPAMMYVDTAFYVPGAENRRIVVESKA
jgi:hypothetical protein